MELIKCNQWTPWKIKRRKGQKKSAKVPYNAFTEKYANVTDFKTWADFETVQSAYEDGGYAGVGFVLTDNDPYIGIDIDDCFINGEITLEAKKIVDRLHSYTEKSPSGNGLRIFIKGDLRIGGRRKGNIEVYKSGHFLTVTGRHWPIRRLNPRKIQNRKNEFEKLYSELFTDDFNSEVDIELDCEPVRLEKDSVLLKAKAHFGHNPQLLRKFSALFNKGDWKSLEIYPTHSEADLALCNLLARLYEGDQDYIDGAFRVSKLMRRKWRRKDYREGTIKKAIARYRKLYPEKLTETPTWEDIEKDKKYNAFKSVLTINEFIELEKSPMQKILNPWIEMPSCILIYGPPESAKTLFALALLKHIVTGRSFGEWEVISSVKSLFFDAEMPPGKLKRYCSALNHIGENKKQFDICSAARMNSLGLPWPNIFNPAFQRVFKQHLIDNNYGLWVLDNIFSAAGGVDLNSAETFNPFNRWLMDLRSNNITTILCDHANRQGKYFGTTLKTVAMDIVVHLTKKKEPKEENALTVNFEFEKHRIDLRDLSQIKKQEVTFKFDGEGNGILSFKEAAVKKNSTWYRVLEFIDGGLKKQTDIGNKMGITQPAVSQTFKDLRKKRYIDENDNITEKGRKILDDHSEGGY
jgi:hypothetical protein